MEKNAWGNLEKGTFLLHFMHFLSRQLGERDF